MNVYFMYRSKLPNQFILTVHWISCGVSCSARPIESLETSYDSFDLYMKYKFSWEATSPLNHIFWAQFLMISQVVFANPS